MEGYSANQMKTNYVTMHLFIIKMLDIHEPFHSPNM